MPRALRDTGHVIYGGDCTMIGDGTLTASTVMVADSFVGRVEVWVRDRFAERRYDET